MWSNDEAADDRRRCRRRRRSKILCGCLVRINEGHVNVKHAPPCIVCFKGRAFVDWENFLLSADGRGPFVLSALATLTSSRAEAPDLTSADNFPSLGGRSTTNGTTLRSNLYAAVEAHVRRLNNRGGSPRRRLGCQTFLRRRRHCCHQTPPKTQKLPMRSRHRSRHLPAYPGQRAAIPTTAVIVRGGGGSKETSPPSAIVSRPAGTC